MPWLLPRSRSHTGVGFKVFFYMFGHEMQVFAILSINIITHQEVQRRKQSGSKKYQIREWQELWNDLFSELYKSTATLP
jgi:hypothetical protein